MVVEERSLTGTWDINTLKRWKWKTAQHPGKGRWSKVFGVHIVIDYGSLMGSLIKNIKTFVRLKMFCCSM